jgi:hypothetical protein
MQMHAKKAMHTINNMFDASSIPRRFDSPISKPGKMQNKAMEKSAINHTRQYFKSSFFLRSIVIKKTNNATIITSINKRNSMSIIKPTPLYLDHPV